MSKDDNLYDEEEGARPSSLRPVHKLSTPDPLYDQQLLRDVAIINERTRKELGPLPHKGVPATPKRKPELPYASLDGAVADILAAHQSEENDTVKLQHLAMVAALGVAAGGSPMVYGSPASEAAKISSVKLGPEYKKIKTFSGFREKLIADGWVPVPNPDCHDAVLGDYYDEYCHKKPHSISCRLCTIVPEIFRSTSDGYNLMRYTKGGVPLGVTVYGDVNDLDEPGRFGLIVVGWEYSESFNVILLD